MSIQIGQIITITKSDYSQITGTLIQIKIQEMILSNGTISTTYYHVSDEKGNVHIGTI